MTPSASAASAPSSIERSPLASPNTCLLSHHTIWSRVFKNAPRTTLRQGLLVHGSLLGVAVLVELALLLYAYHYEAQMAPAGVFVFLGLAGTGGLTIIIEAMKLPLAIHLIGARGSYRLIAWVGVLMLCGLTFLTVKDMVNNQAIVALAPSNALQAEAERLRAENTSLEQSAAARGDAAASAREDRDTIEKERTTRLEALANRRAEVASDWNQRLLELRDRGLLDAGSQARLDDADARRDRESADFADRLEAIDGRLAEARQRHAASIAAAESRYREAMASWEVERARRSEEQRAMREDAADELAAARAAYDRDLAAFNAAVARIEGDRRQVHAELARRIEAHRKNDAPFYDLDGKIRQERAWADTELARLTDQQNALTRPVAPASSSVASTPLDAPHAARPVLTLPDSTEIDRLEAERRRLSEERATALAAIDAESASVRAAATEVSAARQAAFDAKVSELTAARDQALAEHDARISEAERGYSARLAALRDVAVDEVAVQAFVADARATVEKNSAEIIRLEHEADDARSQTEVFRIAEFLRPIMPGATIDRRIEVARTAQAIAIGLICAFAPAMLLKSAVHHLVGTPMAVGGVAGRRRRRRSFGRARLHARYMARIARMQEKSDADESAWGRRLEAERLEAERELKSSLESLADEHRLILRREIDARDARIRGLEGDLEDVRRLNAALEREADRDRARAAASEAQVADRLLDLERVAMARESLRNQRLEAAIEAGRVEADARADARVRAKIEALQSRIEAEQAEAKELRRDREDLLEDNRQQRDVIARHTRTIAGMREDLERLGRTVIDLSEGNHPSDNPRRDA